MKAFGTILFTSGTMMLIGATLLAGVHSVATGFGDARTFGSLVGSPLVLPIAFAAVCSAVGARLAGIGRRQVR